MHAAWPFLAKAASAFFPPTPGIPGRCRFATQQGCDRGQRWPGVDPLVGSSTLVRGSSVSVGLPTTLAITRISKTKKNVRRRGRWAGCARVHERIVLTHCLSQRRRSERIGMPSLFDPDATGNTQDLEMSGSQGSIKREGSRGVEGPRQLRRKQ